MSDQDDRDPAKGNEADDPLAGLEDHLRPPDEGARAAGALEPDDEQTSDTDVESDDAEDEPADEETEEENYREKYEALKRTVGKQANELGDLRKVVQGLAPQQPQAQGPSPFEQRVQKMRDRWGDELTDSIVDLVREQVEPVRATAGVLELQQRYPDFSEVRADMESIFSRSPALRDAAMRDNSVLDTVYEAAKAVRMRSQLDENSQKEKARSRKVATMRDDAHVERPSPKAPPPKKLSEKERNAAWIDSLIAMKPNE